MDASDKFYWICLNRIDGVGPVTFVRLLETFGRAENVFKAKEKDLCLVKGIRALSVQAILSFKDFKEAEKEQETMEDEKVQTISYQDSLYPPRLKEISAYPPILFVKGHIQCLLQGDWLGVVGSRNVSEYGVMACKKIVHDLVLKGVRITSGFARGVDITAHITTVENGGFTVGVQGCGLGHIHPSSHRHYVEKIIENGAIVSEFPYNMLPQPQLFPRRNRIISGLSRGVLVVEATLKSGALITAQNALDQNRDLFAISGSIFSNRSSGCHQLIQDGAKLVGSAEDILKEWSYRQEKLDQVQFADPDEHSIYNICLEKSLTPDEILEKTGFNTSRVTMLLTKMELDGRMKSLPGRRYQSL